MLRKRTIIISGISLCALGSIAFLFASKPAYVGHIKNANLPAEKAAWAQPNSTSNNHNYNDILAKLESERLQLASRYQRVSSPEQRAAIVAESRAVITRSIFLDLFPAWYGTAWDFNGTSEIPRQGKIACGYFVSTVLRDASFRVERTRLAQQASENIILSLTTDRFVKRFRRAGIGDFVNAVKQLGPGIYVVGLDIHVGFIVNTGDEVYFIHASYVEPYSVVKEKAIESTILASSKYRVLGNVFADDQSIRNWLGGTKIRTVF
jgi:hypothetical protein